MYDDLKTLFKSILQLYIKQSVIDNCSNAISYKNIDLLNKSHIELAIAKLLKKYIATSVEIEVFKTECLITTMSFLSPQLKKYLNIHILRQQLFILQGL